MPSSGNTIAFLMNLWLLLRKERQNNGNGIAFTRVPCDRFHVESASPKHASRSLK